MEFSGKRVIAASLLAASIAGTAGITCQAEVAEVKSQLQSNQAQEDLRRDVASIQERTRQDAKPVNLRELKVNVNNVVFEQNDSISESTLRFLLPALKKDKVSIYLLSQEIQLANDNCGVKLNADFRRAGAGYYDVYVSVVPQKQEFASITIANNGTGYDTGDWRATASYVDKNVTGNGDTLGVAYVTAPEHWENVQQAAVSYKWLLPSAHDTMTFTASHSKVDLGNVGGINDAYLRGDGSDSHFNLLKAGMNYQYRTEDDWIACVRANAQYSNNKVVSSERFGLGGQTSIRGFNERIISGDKGISGSLEFMSPQVIKNGRMYIFTDMGQISSNQSNSASRNLSSAGIGFRFNDPVNFWSIDLSYTKILQGFDESNEPDNAYKRWNLMAAKTF